LPPTLALPFIHKSKGIVFAAVPPDARRWLCLAHWRRSRKKQGKGDRKGRAFLHIRRHSRNKIKISKMCINGKTLAEGYRMPINISFSRIFELKQTRKKIIFQPTNIKTKLKNLESLKKPCKFLLIFFIYK
jgi:hypothetical protein